MRDYATFVAARNIVHMTPPLGIPFPSSFFRCSVSSRASLASANATISLADRARTNTRRQTSRRASDSVTFSESRRVRSNKDESEKVRQRAQECPKIKTSQRATLSINNAYLRAERAKKKKKIHFRFVYREYLCKRAVPPRRSFTALPALPARQTFAITFPKNNPRSWE